MLLFFWYCGITALLVHWLLCCSTKYYYFSKYGVTWAEPWGTKWSGEVAG